jgi:Ser/Thr protein kinase RdoA (MazF antagonist)
LAQRGVSAPEVIASKQGELVEKIMDGKGEYFLVTAFTKAPGVPPWEYGWRTELYEAYGNLIGKIHAFSKDYVLPNPDWARPHWDDYRMLDTDRNLPETEEDVLEKFNQLVAYLKSLPRDRDVYGLTHFDAHAANFFVDAKGTITLFDFEDCAYCWYMHDIAIVLFYMVMESEDKRAFTQEFMTHFLRGYLEENELDREWLGQIPHFLKLREIDLYGVIHRSFDIKNLDDPWCARYMQGRKEKILQDVPYLDFEFERLANKR